jgi:YVTN family beta-propeller protein
LLDIVIAPCNTHIYVSDEAANCIDDYSVAAATTETPIPVGSAPNGFDITPDGRRLYVANRGGTNISVVDLGTRQELKKLSFTSNFSGDTPLSLAIAVNNQAFFSTTFAGSGFGGRMMNLDLTTEVITQQTDFFVGGTTTEATELKASADHSVVAAVAGDISSAPVFVYTTATNKFSAEHDLNGFVSEVAVSADGGLILVNGTYVLDDSLNLLGTIAGSEGATEWAAFGPSGSVAYRSAGDHIDILDPVHFLVTGSIPVTADTMQGGLESNVGNLAVSSDGHWLAVISDHGITIVDIP